MSECIFCKIVKKEIPSEIIYEDDVALAVLDVHPVAPGHTMILPKIHAETILGVSNADLGPLFSAVKKVTGWLQDALQPDGFTIGINHGKWAGQAIDHLHIHIIPRWKTDGGSSIHGIVSNPSQETLTEMKNKIIKE
ncbi:MAG: HIT family protein [Candidatus Paceibacterota bacterium]|jgi:histidine triad (HIT) family protein